MSKGYIAKRVARDSLKNNWGKAITVFMTVCAVWIFIVISEQAVRLLFNIPLTVTILSDTGEKMAVANTSLFSILITTAGTLLFLFFFLPLTLGQYLWHCNNSKGSENEVSAIFSPFSSSKNLFKSVWYFFNISFRRFFWLLVFLVPVSITFPTFDTLLSEVEAQYLQYLNLGLTILKVALIILSLTLYTLFSMRYFLAPYLLVSDSTLSVNKAIEQSIILMKNRKVEAFWFVLSFFGWFLLCIFVLPALYVFPFYANARAHYARNIVDSFYAPMTNPTDLAYTREFSTREYQTI